MNTSTSRLAPTIRRSFSFPTLLGFILPLVLGFAVLPRPSLAGSDQIYRSEKHDFRLEVIVEGLAYPWSLAFLPEGDILVTEKPGRLRVIRDGILQPEPIAGLPEIAYVGQGGLLDVVPHPDFAANRLLYLSYSAQGEGGYSTRVARGRLVGSRLVEVEEIFRATPLARGGRHFGSRLAFGPEGLLYVTVGDRATPPDSQDLLKHSGKILRIRDDGSAPPNNPFADNKDAQPEIFSLGNRNPQGLTVEPGTGRIWAIEHGPRGGDELNVIEAGVNYGWPVITYGRAYTGGKIGRGTSFPGLAQPSTYWVPSISPSGLTFYNGEAFPDWRGDLFLGALSGELLVRLEVEGKKVVAEERLLEDFGERIRDVRQGPDGLLYILTDDSDGALLRLRPAN